MNLPQLHPFTLDMAGIMLMTMVLLALRQDRLSEILERIRNDSIEVRDRATTELTALGEPVRPVLEQGVRTSTDLETRSRFQEVLRRLDYEKRRKEFSGGKPVDDIGLRLTVKVDKDAHKLLLSVEVMNLGLAERSLVEVTSWNSRLPYLHSSSSGSQGEIRITQLTGQVEHRGYTMRFSCGGRPRLKTSPLKAGESRTYPITFDLSDFTPGEHQVEARLLMNAMATSEDVVSDVRRFTIEE